MAGELTSRSPWDERQTVWSGPADDAGSAARAVAAMAAAFPRWSRDHARRRALLTDLAGALDARRAAIVDLLVREAGKTAADAGAEADLLGRKIAITLDQGLARTPLDPPPAAAGTPVTVWRPRGVAVALGPFNFPLHLLHGLVVPALAVGCTVVAKPSERCPGLGALYRECLAAAGLAETCAVVQGGAAVAQALVAQPAVATVALVGGRATGLALAESLAGRPEVVLALELGGVNHAVLLDDADPATAAAAVADGAWKMAGQRCTATRVVHVPAAAADGFIALLAAQRRGWIGDGTPAGASGPLISVQARERFLAAYRALPPGIELVAGSVTPRDAHSGLVEPLLLAVRDPRARADALYTEEHFGPALVVDPYADEDDCLRRMAANPHRLAAAVFTTSRERFLACAARLPYGQVNHDRPTAGARSDQPFGGLGRSGNGRPAAVAAGQIFADETVVW
jgi:succinylglutamic semialdehyde dehydrogenase